LPVIKRADGRLKSPLHVASTENHPRPFLVAKQTEQPSAGLINPVIEERPHPQSERWQGNQRAGLIRGSCVRCVATAT